MISCLLPRLDERSRLLILGSMPGIESLRQVQYYAHPRNRFWPVMEFILDMPPGLKYEERIMFLNDSGIGLWDVLSTCKRKGSLDSRIIDSSERFNDFRSLFLRYDDITDIACNGNKAYKAFSTRIEPFLDRRIAQRLTIIKLPSTSPANAACRMIDLVKAWSILKTNLRC